MSTYLVGRAGSPPERLWTHLAPPPRFHRLRLNTERCSRFSSKLTWGRFFLTRLAAICWRTTPTACEKDKNGSSATGEGPSARSI